MGAHTAGMAERCFETKVPTVRISLKVDYALRAMAELAYTNGRPVKAEEIAAAEDIPIKYLLQTLTELKRAHLVRSQRGPSGGFQLCRPPSQISLADVFRAVDGPLADVHDQSLSGLAYPAPAAALPDIWMAIRASLRRVLETVSLAELVAGALPDSVAALADEYRRARHRHESLV